MPTCTLCKEDKPKKAFGIRKDRPSGHTSSCKQCSAAVKRTRKKYTQYPIYQAAWRQWRATEIKQILVQEHGGKCKRCNIEFPLEAFDFDHMPEKGPKEVDVGALISACSLKKAREEARKCQLLCACCHRIVTRERFLVKKKVKETPIELLQKNDLIELVWADATESPTGDPDKAELAIRKTYGLFFKFNAEGPEGAIVLTNTKDEDDTDQSGYSAYPLGMIMYVRLIRRASNTDTRCKHHV